MRCTRGRVKGVGELGGRLCPRPSVCLAGLKRCRLRVGGAKNQGESRLMIWEKK